MPGRFCFPWQTSERSERYVLHARDRQPLSMTIGSDDRQSVFSIVKPSPGMSRIEFIDGATAVTHWSGKPVLSVDYVVIVLAQGGQGVSHFKRAVTLRWVRAPGGRDQRAGP